MKIRRRAYRIAVAGEVAAFVIAEDRLLGDTWQLHRYIGALFPKRADPQTQKPLTVCGHDHAMLEGAQRCAKQLLRARERIG